MTKWLEGITIVMMLAFGASGYLAAQHIGGFSFDPLGSKAIPAGVSALLVGVSLLALAFCLFRPKREDGKEDTEIPQLSSFVQPLITLLLTAGFLYSVFVLRVPLSLMTTLFISLAAAVLAPDNRLRRTTYGLITGLILGFGIEWIFTSFFFVDIPTLG